MLLVDRVFVEVVIVGAVWAALSGMFFVGACRASARPAPAPPGLGADRRPTEDEDDETTESIDDRAPRADR